MNKFAAFAVVVLMGCASIANAAVVTVDSQLNSLVGGTPLNSMVQLTAGQTFTVAVDPSTIWNFGGGNPSYNTNADGSGMGFAIGNPDGSTFFGSIGALIGQIGTGTADVGNFFAIGTNFAGTANANGALNLFFLDSDSFNNIGAVAANITVVPEPASLSLMALGLIALARRRRV